MRQPEHEGQAASSQPETVTPATEQAAAHAQPGAVVENAALAERLKWAREEIDNLKRDLHRWGLAQAGEVHKAERAATQGYSEAVRQARRPGLT